MKSYDHIAIEKKWQKKWEESGIYHTPDSVPNKKNKYVLVEYPYPSGDLHVGHWYAFAVPDLYVRYSKMQGENVLWPIGFDSFGLPAENAAIKRKLDPRKWTYDNIEHMTEQIKSMGNAFDWSRKIVTSDPEYYKWTQWLFLRLHEHNLAYKKQSAVPWCDTCKTVLANEQILSGSCERCDTEVTQKNLDQWFFRITQYADRLIDDLEALNWPKEIKEAQKEWIGRSTGTRFTFATSEGDSVDVFTTRADTLFGATYIVLSPEHEKIESWKRVIENWDEVDAYRKKASQKKELERKEAKEKSGVPIKGVVAIHPATKEKIPIWVADYVLGGYGTGSIMAVPAHDERDHVFATLHNLPIVEVVQGGTDVKKEAYTGEGPLVNSGAFNGVFSRDAKEGISSFVKGEQTMQYRLRDWLLSRQRYWGCPIPIVYDPEGNPHPVPEEHLPWLLPEDVDFTPTGEAPLARSKELKARTEKIFGTGWTPEVDTMDTFVDSSWYFLRYLDPKNDAMFMDPEKEKLWMPVYRYSGGGEHTTMHLLYSRFFQKALFDIGLVKDSEPYTRRMNRGLILGPDGAKMSKSKGNVINPDDHVKAVGADTVKMYLAFIGPFSEVGQYPWDTGGMAGIRRFLERVYALSDKVALSVTEDEEVHTLLHQTIKKVGEDIEAHKFNTAISQIMILANALEKQSQVTRSTYITLVTLLAPFAPHLTEEIWESLGNTTSIHLEAWPQYDGGVLAQATKTIAVQVNGKTRGTFDAPVFVSEEDMKTLAREIPTVQTHLRGKALIKEIVVQGRLVNFVVKDNLPA